MVPLMTFTLYVRLRQLEFSEPDSMFEQALKAIVIARDRSHSCNSWYSNTDDKGGSRPKA